MDDLFLDDAQNQPDKQYASSAPLAERLRPRMIADIVGQDHLVGDHGAAVADAVDEDPPIGAALRHREARGEHVVGQVGRLRGVRAEVLDLVTVGPQQGCDLQLEAETGVVAGQRDAHGGAPSHRR